MKSNDPEKIVAWLQTSPKLSELCAAYPEEWETVQHQLAEVLEHGNPDEVVSYLKQKSYQGSVSAKKTGTLPVREMVRYQMAHAAVKQHCVSVASGVESGKVRFNLLNGFIAQKLLFSHNLERKPASLFWFRLIWPLIRQKRYLMPLVQPKGIYCFYSLQLIVELSRIIGNRHCLEIAAGDGTLSRFLKQRGVQVTATDDYSWQHSVSYPEWVVKNDAKAALSLYSSEVVICSWPPARNGFERQVFRTRSVQLYILITSRHQHAAGNWDAYREQQFFAMQEDAALSQLVLPPEIDAVVYLFTRRPSA
ncbi:MAG: hypothetical protein PHH28_04560 [Desulfuromonadaceae bacterium]|nr:hypothetical protein [Desulfuromonadaceae bacterium]